jgi:putative transposase
VNIAEREEGVTEQRVTGRCEEIDLVCLDNRSYGSRRVIIELQKLGLPVNRKRVMRLMRADNLLCLRKRRFVCTTAPSFPVDALTPRFFRPLLSMV